MFDPSSSDVTGHVLEAFTMILESLYANEFAGDIIPRIKASLNLAVGYLNDSFWHTWSIMTKPLPKE